MRSYYAILGVAPGADQETIKAAFRELAKRSHPDVNRGDLGAEQRFKEISHAYGVLSDPEVRAAYDLDLQREGDLTRQRVRRAASTMAVTFVLTVGVGLAAALWRQTATADRTAKEVPNNGSAVPGQTPTSKSISEQSAFAEQPAEVRRAAPFGKPDPDVSHPPNIVASRLREQMPDEAGVPGATASSTPPRQGVVANREASEAGKERKEPAGPAPIVPAPIDVQQSDPSRLANAEPGDPRVESPPAIAGKLAGWTTYRNSRFGFALKYPADVFTPEAAPAENALRTFVSRDSRVQLHIHAMQNEAGETLAKHRRSLMEQRYSGATYDYTPQQSHWFVLSGTRGEEMFYERVTFSCDGRSMHGWRLTYPLAERAVYDRIVEEIHRSYRHGAGAGARCGEPKGLSARPLTPLMPIWF
jgi:curved DNA-binding protein CbpA